jgi:hypothetical protein
MLLLQALNSKLIVKKHKEYMIMASIMPPQDASRMLLLQTLHNKE